MSDAAPFSGECFWWCGLEGRSSRFQAGERLHSVGPGWNACLGRNVPADVRDEMLCGMFCFPEAVSRGKPGGLSTAPYELSDACEPINMI